MADQWMYRFGAVAHFGPFGSREEATHAARSTEIPLRVYPLGESDIADGEGARVDSAHLLLEDRLWWKLSPATKRPALPVNDERNEG